MAPPKAKLSAIVPFLWFADQAEEAANYYVGIFDHSEITAIARYPAVGEEQHGRAPGSVMTVAFELAGQRFTALNGGPHFEFNNAISFVVECDTQEQLDYFWEKLGAGGEVQQCGWLRDRFGLSWQVVPTLIRTLWLDENSPGSQRAFAAMMKMKKLDLAALQQALVEA